MCRVEEREDVLSFSQLESLDRAEPKKISAIVGKMAARCADLFSDRPGETPMFIQIERLRRSAEVERDRTRAQGRRRPVLGQALSNGLANLAARRPLLAVFQACLRCNSSCGYCNLPLNVGRYEMTREEIQRVFTSLYWDGIRFVLLQG